MTDTMTLYEKLPITYLSEWIYNILDILHNIFKWTKTLFLDKFYNKFKWTNALVTR